MDLTTPNTTETRERLLAAGEVLVGRHGTQAVSMADVGLEAGLSRGAVTYVFGSKDGLMTALTARAARTWSAIDVSPRAPDVGGWLDGWLRPLFERPEPLRLSSRMLFESLAGRQTLRGPLAVAWNELVARIGAALDRYHSLSRPELPPTPAVAPLVAAAAFGVIGELLADGSAAAGPAYAELRAILVAAAQS